MNLDITILDVILDEVISEVNMLCLGMLNWIVANADSTG